MRIKLDDDAAAATAAADTFAPITSQERGGGKCAELGAAAGMWVRLLMPHVHKFMMAHASKSGSMRGGRGS